MLTHRISVESMHKTYAHPSYKEIVSPDEAKFAKGPMKYVVQQEIVQWDYTDGDVLKDMQDVTERGL